MPSYDASARLLGTPEEVDAMLAGVEFLISRAPESFSSFGERGERIASDPLDTPVRIGFRPVDADVIELLWVSRLAASEHSAT